MENVIVNYSDFFNDDGGMKKVLDDFTKLGESLTDEAKRVKKELNAAFVLDNDEIIKKYEAKIEEITKANEAWLKGQKNVIKISEDWEQLQKDLIDTAEKLAEATNESTDAIKSETTAMEKNAKTRATSSKLLEDLNIELEQHKLAIKAVTEMEKAGLVSTEKAIKARTEGKLRIKEINTEIRKEEQALLSLGKATKQEIKLREALITIEKEEVKTISDVRERIAALRIVVQSLDMEAEADKIAAYNSEIDDLTDTLSDNSDQFIQNKINIGNYEESIKNALKSSNLFRTNIAVIDGALDKFADTLAITRQEAEEMEKTLDQNSGALKRFQVAFGRMNGVLKASVIGAVIVAIAALATVFAGTRKGAANTEKVMQSLATTITTVGQVAKAVFVNGFKAYFYALTFQFDKAKEELKTGAKELEAAFSNGVEAIVLGLEYIDRAIKIEDRVRALTRELEKANGKLAIFQAKADNATTSLNSQLQNSKLAFIQLQKNFALQRNIAELQLEAVNNRIRQNAIAHKQEADFVRNAGEGLAFAEKIQELAQQRGVDLEIDNALIEEQAELMLEIQRIENETALATYENKKQQMQINQDLFEQNLDLLIDVIDVQKNLSEAFVNDTNNNVMARMREFESFIKRFRENAQDEIAEFNTLFKKQADILGTKAPKFDLKFDDNGQAKIFLDGILLSTDQAVGKIKELNKQLQMRGIAEIPINRFREFIVETGNAKRDFDALEKSLDLLLIKFQQMKNEFAITKLEDSNLKRINDRIAELSQIKLESIPRRQRLKAIKELEELQKERERVLKDGEANRKQNRINAINAELKQTKVLYENGTLILQKVVAKGSEKENELLQEKAALQREINEGIAEDRVKSIEDANAKAEEAYQRFVDDVQGIISLVLDKVTEMQAKVVSQQEELVDKQANLITKQEERAAAGLQNTLVFEQKMLAQREAELVRAQKKQERLEKIKALYTSYTNYANKGDENPILKALRDFAILESITASFGQGGVVEDRLPTDGIFRGQSHNGNSGGIPILVEGREGIFSAREMDNLGKDNFYKIKDMAGKGKLDENFFSRQRRKFVEYRDSGSVNTDKLEKRLDDVKKAIENKEVPNWNLVDIIDGQMHLVEERKSKNKTTRFHYKTKKPRL